MTPRTLDPSTPAFHMTDAGIVAEARSWIGTRWVHGQRVKGAGTDCVGFIIELGKAFQWIPSDYTPPVYSRQHALHRDTSLLLGELARFARIVPPEDRRDSNIKVGDILAFYYQRTAGHAGIYIGEGPVLPRHTIGGQVRGSGGGLFVHAYMPKRKVLESSLNEFIADLHSVWRPKEHEGAYADK